MDFLIYFFEFVNNLKLYNAQDLFNYTIFLDEELACLILLNESKTQLIGVLEYYKWNN